MAGWIKLHRQLRNNPHMNQPNYRAVWTEILLEAQHKPRDVIFKGKRITLKPGQFTCGSNQLSEWTGVPASSVRRILKIFKSEQQIDVQASNKFSLITVLNWDKYQGVEQQSEQQVSINRAASEQQVATPKECKNEKNDKKSASRSLGNSIPPAIEDVTEYFIANGRGEEASKFYNFYDSKGWMVGKTKMKKWRSSVGLWISRSGGKFKNVTPTEWRNLIKENKVKHQEIFDFYIGRGEKEPNKLTKAILSNNGRENDSLKYEEGAEKENQEGIQKLLSDLNK